MSWHWPGPVSVCGGLWTTGLQDRLVRTMAAMISSISTDSGLRKLETTTISLSVVMKSTHAYSLTCNISLTCVGALQELIRFSAPMREPKFAGERPGFSSLAPPPSAGGLMSCSCGRYSPRILSEPGHSLVYTPTEGGDEIMSSVWTAKTV